MWCTGLVDPRHVGSAQTRARTRVPCIGRQILNHCATREARSWSFEIAFRCTFYTQQKRPFVYKLRVTGKTLHVVCLRFHPRLGRQCQPTEQAEVGSRGEDESPFCLLLTESVWLTEVTCASFHLGLSEDRGLGEHI